MALRIVSADQRLAEANGKTTVALFGPSGVGKTSLAADVAGGGDAVHRPRGRAEVGSGLAGRVDLDPYASPMPSTSPA